ncbi:hypothetical protein Bbelb_314200 [Branchiostoma belcheri]|nr:hypothetical protein Bbelb_314200 [Branchiostoma belcheri]
MSDWRLLCTVGTICCLLITSCRGEGAWLRQDTSWVVNSTGTPWVMNGVTHDAAKALDGDTNTYWNVMDTWRNYNNWYIVLDIAAPLNLTRIAVNCNGDTNHDIAAFKLQSSPVGSPYSWEDVVSVDNVQGGTDQRQEFGGFQGTARYWRFVVTRTHGGWQPHLTELNLYSISPAQVIDCMEDDGTSYRGTVTVTGTGRTCQRWDRQTPHKHTRTSANYPSSGLEQNYCRNPDHEPTLWCYTTDPGKRWEFCDVPHCDGQLGAWLRQDTSWVVNSTGTPWVMNGVTHDAAKALDGDTNTYWNVSDTWRNYNNWYIVLDIAAPLTLTRIAVNSYGDTTNDIAAFKLQSSQVGSPYSWEDVVSVDNVQGGTDQRKAFAGFQGTARYWRFVVTRTHEGFQPFLTELNLYSISPAACSETAGDFLAKSLKSKSR